MIFCHLRGKECDCHDEQCVSAPHKPIAHAIIPTWRDQLAVCVFVGVIAGIAAFAVAARAEPYFKIQQQIAQESGYHG